MAKARGTSTCVTRAGRSAEREGFEAAFWALASRRSSADLAWKILENQPFSPESGFNRIVYELGPRGQFCPQFAPKRRTSVLPQLGSAWEPPLLQPFDQHGAASASAEAVFPGVAIGGAGTHTSG
jgi:hypothetical protein